MSKRGFVRCIVVIALVSAFALSSVPSLASRTTQASPGGYEWVREFGSYDSDYAPGIAIDASGVYVAGWTTGDAFVRKYDSGGNDLWTSQFGTAVGTFAYDVAADSSGVYVAGYTFGAFPGLMNAGSTDAFIRKYDSGGIELWTRQFGTTLTDITYGIGVGASGVYVTGFTSGTFPGETKVGSDDVFVSKYDSDGNAAWTRQFGTTDWDVGYGIAVDSSGVYVAGYTFGAFSGQTSAGEIDGFVRKYDSSGNEMWTRQFGTASSEYTFKIAVDASGAYVAGYTGGSFPGQTNAGGVDGFVRKYDSGGNELWTREFGTASDDAAYGIAVDSSGVYVAGYTWGAFPGLTNAGYDDGYVRKYDSGGNEVWTREFGTASYEYAYGVAADASGAYVSGDTWGTFPGQTSLTPPDVYVVKLSPNAPGPLKATLSGRRAWPAYSHLVISKNGQYQTLYGKMANAGPGAVNAIVVFTIYDSSGSFVSEVSSDVARIPVGGKTTVHATWMVQPGSYSVTAQCWYDSDDNGSLDSMNPLAKTFSFRVI